MICIKDHRQNELFDPWDYLSPKRRQMLDDSWPGLFKKHILPFLPIGCIAPLFTAGFGRPGKELHTIAGTLILQQAFDLTDEEARRQLSFNIEWHYALNITEETDSAKYMCPKTLWNFRTSVIEKGLDSILFESVTDTLIQVFGVNTDSQRIDSVHIQSNMKRLGRIGIFTRSIQTFLTNLKKKYPQHLEIIDQQIIEKYHPEKSQKCFSMLKPSESQKTLAGVSCDLFELIQIFSGCSEVCAMRSYKQLERVLNEQCRVVETDQGTQVEVRKPKEIPGDSLQNPSDPDASYSGHKGQGYQVQVMETYSRAKESEEKTLNLITYVHVEPAHLSDADALMPAIEETQKRDTGPKEVLADTLYGSDKNCQAAAEAGVEVVAPAPGKETNRLSLTDFELTGSGIVITCPAGHAPVRIAKRKKRFTVAFDSPCCGACTHLNKCPVKQGKHHYYLRYTEKDIRIARRRAYEKMDEFTDRYRFRSGVEATMSQYDRKTGVKKLRVRGLKNVRFCAVMKAIAINIFRAASAWKASGSGFCQFLFQFFVIFWLKMHIFRFWKQMRRKFYTKLLIIKRESTFIRK